MHRAAERKMSPNGDRRLAREQGATASSLLDFSVSIKKAVEFRVEAFLDFSQVHTQSVAFRFYQYAYTASVFIQYLNIDIQAFVRLYHGCCMYLLSVNLFHAGAYPFQTVGENKIV